MFKSYEGIMYALWIMHMIAFAFKARIYYPKLREGDVVEKDNSDDFTSALILPE